MLPASGPVMLSPHCLFYCNYNGFLAPEPAGLAPPTFKLIQFDGLSTQET